MRKKIETSRSEEKPRSPGQSGFFKSLVETRFKQRHRSSLGTVVSASFHIVYVTITLFYSQLYFFTIPLLLFQRFLNKIQLHSFSFAAGKNGTISVKVPLFLLYCTTAFILLVFLLTLNSLLCYMYSNTLVICMVQITIFKAKF